MTFQNKKEIKALASKIYSKIDAKTLVDAIEKFCIEYEIKLQNSLVNNTSIFSWDEQSILLITYGDSLIDDKGQDKPLKILNNFLNKYVGNSFEFVHLLPFFPYTSDDGFSVVDFRKVNSSLGSWDEIHSLSQDYKIVFDAVINHVSASSHYMKEQCLGNVDYKDFLITVSFKKDWSNVVRPRKLPLLSEYETSEGMKYFWTTFSQDQIDLNYKNPKVLLEIIDILLYYYLQGARMLRLDAIAFLWKEEGSLCIHLEQTHNIIKLFRKVFEIICPDMIILTETNVPHQENISYFGNGDEAHLVYNFALPPLILYTLIKGNSKVLTKWSQSFDKKENKECFLNMTATHDGIGVRPVESILTPSEITEVVHHIEDCGGKVSYKTNMDGSESPYELNIVYFDALGGGKQQLSEKLHVDKFLVSQMIALSFIGIPAVYIHSLLGSRNDLEGMKKTGKNRSINRQKIPIEEIENNLKNPSLLRSKIFYIYKERLKLRQKQKAFSPNSSQKVLDIHPSLFVLIRGSKEWGQTIYVINNLSNEVVTCNIPELESGFDLLTKSQFENTITLQPYQVLWIEV